ncbi:MAG: hypothetical protein BWX54_01547 [Verrucomicrobia bacterium ADurb.Bin018]|nr:MAG: hypothetical protein BWX54_01547 [Verrucomicrobia bacterium ADurb.Bin018]
MHAGRAGAQARRQHQSRAHPRHAMLVADMLHIFLAEVPQRGEHRIWRGLPQPAQRGLLNEPPQLFEAIQIGQFALALANALQDFAHALGAHPAWRALAAGFLLHKFNKEPRHIHHAGVFIHDDQATRAHDGAQFLQAFVIQRHVEIFLGDAAAGRPTDLRGFVGLAAAEAAADVIDQFAERRAHRHLHQPRILHAAGQCKHLGALALGGSPLRVPSRAVQQNGRHIGICFHVIQQRGLAPQTLLRGEWRARTRFAAQSLNGGNQRRFFAADKCAGPHADVQIKREAAAEDVIPQQPAGVGLVNGLAQARHRQRIFCAYIHIALRRADGERGNGHALNDAVRVAFQRTAIHVGARVAFIRVAQHIFHRARRPPREVPLHKRREACPPPPPQPGTFHFLNDLLGRERGQHFGQRGIAVPGHIFLDAFRINPAAIPQHHLGLPRKERNIRGLGLQGVGLRVAGAQPLHHAPRLHVLAHDIGGIFGFDSLIESPVVHPQHGSPHTGPHAAGCADGHILGHAGLGNGGLQGIHHLLRAGRQTTAAHAYPQLVLGHWGGPELVTPGGQRCGCADFFQARGHDGSVSAPWARAR